MMDNTSRPADGEGVTWLHLAPPTPDRESPARRPDAWVDDMLNALRPLLTEPEGAICDQPRPVRRGGRAAALEAVSTIDPVAYARTRNQLDGAVTRLSPWLRHGVLSTAEIRDLAIGKVAQAAAAEKLVSELAWRDYWQRVYASLGEAIFDNLEEAAAPSRLASSEHVPDDVLNATTGMACIDGFARELQTTGFLHNHARMWLASWLIHARGVRWQAGAAWFLSHLSMRIRQATRSRGSGSPGPLQPSRTSSIARTSNATPLAASARSAALRVAATSRGVTRISPPPGLRKRHRNARDARFRPHTPGSRYHRPRKPALPIPLSG